MTGPHDWIEAEEKADVADVPFPPREPARLVTGPLAPLFAQARDAIEFGYGGDPNYKPFYYAGLDALSVIERHVQELTEQRDAAFARYESYEPGKTEGQIHAIWDLAEHYGHPKFSSKHPVGFLTRFIDDLQRHVQDMEKAIGEALESLATGPAREGYAYSILSRLAAPERNSDPDEKSGASPAGNDGGSGAASTPALPAREKEEE